MGLKNWVEFDDPKKLMKTAPFLVILQGNTGPTLEVHSAVRPCSICIWCLLRCFWRLSCLDCFKDLQLCSSLKGMNLLRQKSAENGWDLKLWEFARIWKVRTEITRHTRENPSLINYSVVWLLILSLQKGWGSKQQGGLLILSLLCVFFCWV